MSQITISVLCLLTSLGPLIAAQNDLISSTDWPWWRGPLRNGIASSDQTLPLQWSETEKVIWKTPVPGRGHGSPTLVGQRIFLATAETEKDSQSVICFDRKTGQPLWQKVIFPSGLAQTKMGHKKSSYASATVACDGERVFINFLNGKAVYTTALSMDGDRLWQKKITDFSVHQGFGSSPAIYGSLVIVAADHKAGGALVGLDRKTGELVWHQERPATANYTSPIILNVAGRDQVFMLGCNRVCSYDPLTGELLWDVPGATTECVSSVVTDGQRLFISGGYPRKHIAALRADGSGVIEWDHAEQLYVPSFLFKDGYLYAVTDSGRAICWHAASGKEQWTQKLPGPFDATCVLVGSQILTINEKGRAFIFEANPEAYVPFAETQLGDEAFATPTVCGGRIYARVAHDDGGKRQEMLYCIGE